MDPIPQPKKRGRPRLPTPERQQNRLASKARWRQNNKDEINQRKRVEYHRNKKFLESYPHKIPKYESAENQLFSTLADFLESPRVHFSRVS